MMADKINTQYTRTANGIAMQITQRLHRKIVNLKLKSYLLPNHTL